MLVEQLEKNRPSSKGEHDAAGDRRCAVWDGQRDESLAPGAAALNRPEFSQLHRTLDDRTPGRKKTCPQLSRRRPAATEAKHPRPATGRHLAAAAARLTRHRDEFGAARLDAFDAFPMAPSAVVVPLRRGLNGDLAPTLPPHGDRDFDTSSHELARSLSTVRLGMLPNVAQPRAHAKLRRHLSLEGRLSSKV